MDQADPNTSQPSTSGGKKAFMTIVGLVILVALAFGLRTGFEMLQTSTLNLSFNRLTSLPITLELSRPGNLVIKGGPSAFARDAQLMTIVLRNPTASLDNPQEPFQIGSPYQVIYNMVNPDNPQQLILSFLFPQDHFTDQEQFVAQLPFSTTQAGEFEVLNVFLGNIPTF